MTDFVGIKCLCPPLSSSSLHELALFWFSVLGKVSLLSQIKLKSPQQNADLKWYRLYDRSSKHVNIDLAPKRLYEQILLASLIAVLAKIHNKGWF